VFTNRKLSSVLGAIRAALLSRPCKLTTPVARPFVEVQNEEAAVLNKLRDGRQLDPLQINGRPYGLCLSGGGIRGATFHLGVLQALNLTSFLRRVDYLSAVSGGAFLASWFCKWIAASNYNDVSLQLSLQGRDESGEVHKLRQNVQYLTPKMALFGPDTGY
jgi:hypothetical protein